MSSSLRSLIIGKKKFPYLFIYLNVLFSNGKMNALYGLNCFLAFYQQNVGCHFKKYGNKKKKVNATSLCKANIWLLDWLVKLLFVQALIYINIIKKIRWRSTERKSEHEVKKSSGMWKTRAENRRSCRKIGREESGKTRAWSLEGIVNRTVKMSRTLGRKETAV